MSSTSEPPLRQNLRFTAGENEIYGYLALPPSGSGPGVIVIQEWWGLTDQIAAVADRLAASGYVALAPDLYGGRTTHDSADAFRMLQELPREEGVRKLLGAVDHLLGHEAVRGDALGAVGFCMGGGFVLSLAAAAGDRIAAAVPYYGIVTGEDVDFGTVRAAVLGHYGDRDETIPRELPDQVAEEIRTAAGVPVEIHHYDAGHAFANDEDHLGTYDPELARTAWERTLAFLGEKL
ncbi:dienelactone hydrolase family protein [Streptomyces sulphureus]|uniref:dienelactone hydrolase family protein n=1 Tax=Streptomyces sulphureus TaxID=47758 RepID=UPI00035FFA6B|nr:dienelactone hydrolase family protein [Streptomyces sulphureus]